MHALRAFATLVVLLSAMPAAAQSLSPAIRQSLLCAPVGGTAPDNAPRVAVSTETKQLYNESQQINVEGGEGTVQVGQRFFIRRAMKFREAPRAKHTIGQVTIVDTAESRTVARIESVCDAVAVGDHLEPYVEPVLPPGLDRTNASGRLDPNSSLTVSYGVDGHGLGGGRDFMLADSGPEAGVAPGMRYAAFHRRKAPGDTGQPIAEAIVVATFPGMSLLRITEARDAVETGDQLVMSVGSTADAVPVAIIEEQPRVASGEVERGATARLRVGTPEAPRPSAETFNFDELYFDLNRRTLKAKAISLLDQAVEALRRNPTLRVSIEGFTCDIGTAEYNLALGERRARTVRSYLVDHGVDAGRLTLVSFGEEQPKYDNASEETRKLNRRAALVVNVHEAN